MQTVRLCEGWTGHAPRTHRSKLEQVEYHDPSGVFPLVSADIAARLPLRNLNWQSPPRPLRQIKSLHVDFVPDKSTSNNLRPTTSRTDSEGPNSFDIVRGGPDGRKNAVKERRHQIPGFRTSPYLKVYVLRCDDKDAYKESDRRKIREWIRENAQPDWKREDHDAFEWMILHIVIPDTIAASEPRWREGTRDPDELKERKPGTKLIGKSTRTVFDRLRADFNDSGKSYLDRIAQIRIPKARAPADLLPTPAVAETHEETPQERENTWNDFVGKLKSLILEPFDRRVRQYEADITDQEARRSLPGWNFCTFFIHKEGLAKALESIGLVEDALAIYDELSLGLELVLREIASGEAQGTATSFAAYTDDIRERIVGALDKVTNGTNDETMNDRRDADALFDKDYREKIVRSNISVFDFFCYIFTRQKALILRLANTKSARAQLGVDANKEGGEDLVLTSEVCWRASSFIHNIARTLRQDLMTRAEHKDRGERTAEIEALVCSWTWAVAGLVLDETAAPALVDITRLGFEESMQAPNGKPKRPVLNLGLGANTHPQRTTSLPPNDVKPVQPPRPQSRPRTQDDHAFRPGSSSGAESAKPTGIPGQAELATYRADLISTRRKMLEQVARRHGWYAGWAFAKRSRTKQMEEVSLGETPTDSVLADDEQTATSQDHLSPGLRKALEDESRFQSTYERITNFAIRHYYAATQSKSAEVLLGDIAILKCQQQHFEDAASHFQHILPTLSADSWDLVALEALGLYSRCLKQLQRYEDYVRNGLSLLAKVTARSMERQFPRVRMTAQSAGHKSDGDIETGGLLQDLVAASRDLQQEMIQPMKTFFHGTYLHREIMHESSTDGFGLSLHLEHVLDDELDVDEVGARLVSHDEPSHEIWVTSGKSTVKNGVNKITLKSHATAYGAYVIDKIQLRANKIRFVEELRPPPKPTPLGFTEIEPPTVTVTEPEKAPAFVFLYPAERALSAELRRSKDIHIDKPRRLELFLNAGHNDIQYIEVRFKPISAGLRLHLADTSSEGIDLDKAESGKPGQRSFKALGQNAEAVVIVPYTVEHANTDIAVRLEVQYQTPDGTFIHLQTARLSNEMPLDVDVNDIFHLDALFSNFTVRTTTKSPFLMLAADLADSPVYAVEAPPELPLPVTVYKSQPMKLVYKITRKSPVDSQTLKRDAALALGVSYQTIDELYLAGLRKRFSDALKQSPFQHLCRLLLPLLHERAKHFIDNTDLETAAFLGEANIPGFDILGWQELADTLQESVRLPLAEWLRHWHKDNLSVTWADDGAEKDATKHITISVDVPNVNTVFSASLNLLQAKPPVESTPSVLTLGQPVQATVRVRHTGAWSSKSLFPSVPTFKIHGDSDNQSSFVCDVGTEADTWLVGGQRRCHFVLQDGAENAFNVLLVPLKLGAYPLPMIAVQRESSDPDASENPDDAFVSCETQYESAGQVVQVIRDIRTSRVHIAESPASVALPPSRPGTASTKEPG
ncbi:hypothetical protein M409DRAFT_24510 [Zasmidium cellare ATCC 36951]|uniref:Trafficking protein particle complex subunit 11 domain-containing protein n=1 Tax=Zasmidium cellare ATCC 36951 TaxID=1080233 RepID=A0A6A6CGQ1_ZASCE|nr:uncharacterized protein M409DRAFT_24510 [Zasmidium cellare ATCC 36951]KAF2165122.1 hypothetical protein M409DRAFT_24510 [Zasmidium cellare ATCC 36951]